MTDPTITYIPVGNGDTSLIRLSDESSIIIDCNIRVDSRDDEVESCYDGHAHLLKVLRHDAQGRPFTDAFILTHPDQDHCRGFASTFHTGDLRTYQKKKGEPDKIVIGELWFSQRIFSNYERGQKLSDDAKAFKQEALRRIQLYKSGSPQRLLPGNRIRIIGYGESEVTKGLSDITTIPGSAINLINGSVKSDFSFFVHAPFKRDVIGADRNNTSIVLQARFGTNNAEPAGLAFFGGDACWDIWAQILKRSRTETLTWDLFLSPHHCSWSFFNDVPYENNTRPKQTSLEILRHHRPGATVIASSKPIRDDDDNPPHYAAAVQYKREVGSDHFFCLCETPSEDKPEPVMFRITAKGPQRIESSTPSRVQSVSAVQVSVRNPRIYG